MASSDKFTPYLNVPLSTALLTIDSRDGLKADPATGLIVNPQNPYDINIQKGQQLFSGAVQRIALTEINMPWNIPNVNPTNNILFLEKDDGTTYDLEISPGFYLPEDLATEVETQLNAFSIFGVSTWVCNWNTLDDATFRIITGLTGVKFRILPKFGQSKGISTAYTGFPIAGPRSSTLATMMGFDYVNSDYSATVNGSVASMLYTRYVDIVSSILCKNQDVRDTSSSYFTGNNILARIYISPERMYSITNENIIGTRPFILHKEFITPKEIQWNPTEFLPSCNIRLQDEFGNKLYSLSEYPLSYNPGPAVNSSVFAGNAGWVELTMLISEAST
jgi:hypothetical protein